MAFITQERKREIAPNVKKILKKYGLKGTLSIRDHSTLVLTIREGAIDFLEGDERRKYIDVNTYHIENHYCGIARTCLKELAAAMNEGNWDRSDIMTDYFDVGWYIRINIGKYDKPYRYV